MIELHSFSALLSKDILKDFKFFNQFGPTYKIRNEFLLDILTIMQEKFHISDKDVKLTANSHTGTLDKILTTATKLDNERLVDTERIKRLENWALQVGEKLGIKLEV